MSHKRADNVLFQNVVQNEIDNSVDTNPAFYDFVLSVQAGDQSQIRKILNQLPSYKKMESTEERTKFKVDILRSKYHKNTIGPIATELEKHTSVVVTPVTESKLFALTNDIYNPYRTQVGLDYFQSARGRTDEGTFKGRPLSIAELADDPTKHADIIKVLQSKVAETKKAVGQNFASDYTSVIEDLRREGIELPLLRESTMKDLFAGYVNDQLNNNVGLKTGLYIDPVTEVETAMSTMGIMDEEGGANFIRNRITKSNITINESNKPETPGGREIEKAVVVTLDDHATKQIEGFKLNSLTDDQQEDFKSAFVDFERTTINKIVQENPTMEGLNTASQLAADFLIDQRDSYNFTNFNHLMFREAGIFRQRLAQRFGIEEDLNASSKNMRKLLVPIDKESKLKDGKDKDSVDIINVVERGKQMTEKRLRERSEFFSSIPGLLTPSQEKIDERSILSRTNRRPGLL